ncbi:Cupin domain protein [Thermodesulfobium acidiphilum]|uniref:Cupin domain protein n=1 Tax=Thermodesulfobium acidiphilum TaxID=1794699 RepID=A0A2R4W2N5_THEAF|nr:cupin domain-containing protein [Thermodesulfobium acidiphilum]AWB11071.1 Cupin domain protein [Thermodesulfobium acidiphilum]PMP86386.1 MAG: cupin domain-containing protein [Thermodesulfobium narugense]
MSKIGNSSEVKSEKMEVDGAKGASIKWLITPKDGAPNFSMRLIIIEPNGQSPAHSHDFEHEMFILEGEATVVSDNSETKVSEGSFIFIKPGEFHTVKNTGTKVCKFLCMIPNYSIK